MPTVRHTPIKTSSQKPQTSESQIDKIDYDLVLLDNGGNIPKEVLIEIRRDIDDCSQRLSKLQKRLTEVVEIYDEEHKSYS